MITGVQIGCAAVEVVCAVWSVICTVQIHRRHADTRSAPAKRLKALLAVGLGAIALSVLVGHSTD